MQIVFASLLHAVAYAMTFVPVRGGGGTGGHSSGGGGGGHSGGSSGGGSTHYFGPGSGGGGGGLAGIFLLMAIGVPILIIIFIIVLVVMRSRKRSSVQAYPITIPVANAATQGQDASAIVAEYHQLLAVDPAFDVLKFNESANRVFYAVQTAWCDRNPGLTRQVMADGIWQAHKSQIDGYTERNAHNKLDNLAVQYTYIQHISTGAKQYITQRFIVYSSDYDVDDAGKVIKGNTTSDYWSEDWVFTRDGDVKTTSKPGIADAACPNCGAPMSVDSLGNCDYCHAAIMGGAYDWVLYRIDQLPSLEYAQATAGPTPQALAEMPPPVQQPPVQPPPAQPPPAQA